MTVVFERNGFSSFLAINEVKHVHRDVSFSGGKKHLVWKLFMDDGRITEFPYYDFHIDSVKA